MSATSEFVTYVSTSAHWAGERGIPHRTFEHLRLAASSVVVASAIALPPAVWLGHVRRGGLAAQSLVNIGRAVPSLAIVAILFPLSLRYGFGLGFWPTFGALVLLAIPPMFTNAYVGVRSVDPAVVEAARGMGMRRLQVIGRVQLPSGLPLVLGGVRVATLQVIATATLGAYVGFNGLGSFINEGFRQQDDGKLLTGAVLVALVAFVVDVVFGRVVHRITPWRVASTPLATKGPNL